MLYHKSIKPLRLDALCAPFIEALAGRKWISAIFKRKVYATSSQLGFSVLDFIEPEITPNFFVADIQFENTRLFVLGSYDNNWAFSSKFTPFECELNFIDIPRLASVFQSQGGIKILTKEELNSPFESRAFLSDLDVKYWQPQSLGEGLFNWWD